MKFRISPCVAAISACLSVSYDSEMTRFSSLVRCESATSFEKSSRFFGSCGTSVQYEGVSAICVLLNATNSAGISPLTYQVCHIFRFNAKKRGFRSETAGFGHRMVHFSRNPTVRTVSTGNRFGHRMVHSTIRSPRFGKLLFLTFSYNHIRLEQLLELTENVWETVMTTRRPSGPSSKE